MNSIRRLCLLALIVLPAMLLTMYGCGDDGGTGPVKPDDTISPVLVDSANDSLGTQMSGIINSTLNSADSSFRPRDIDLTGVRAIYQRALAANGSNLDAKFGVAFTGLMMFMADDDFNQLVDDYKALFDTLTFNPFRPASLIPMINIGGDNTLTELPLTVGGFNGMLPSPISLDRGMLSLALVDPTISQIQNNFRDQLLPKLQEAHTYLSDIVANGNYTFAISPAMQGNAGADSIIVDRSDFYVMLAATCAAEAAVNIFLARDLDVSSYTVAGAVEAATKGTTFGDLKTGETPSGTARMQTAKTLILEAETHLQSAVTSLRAEIGTDQTRDLIDVHPGDENDLQRVADTLSYYRSYFDTTKPYSVVWSNWEYYYNGSTWIYERVYDTVTATVDIAKFFDAPMDNPKNFLPDYTVSGEAISDIYKDFVSQYFSRDRYWAAMDTIYGLTYPNDTPYFNYHLPDTDTDEFYAMLADDPYISPDYGPGRQFLFGWDYVYNYCGSSTDLWCFENYRGWDYQYYFEHPDRVGVCYGWDAATFEAWTWPHPDFNGLLPDMTSQGIKDIFTDIGVNWGRQSCDTLDFYW